MNIYDIAYKSGVSIATVSRVLNNSPHVSEKTKKKVLAVMEKEDYTPNIFARSLGLDTMKSIGILCTDSSDTYIAEAIYCIEKELRVNEYNSILASCGEEKSEKIKALNYLLNKRVDAIILVGSTFCEINPEDNAYIQLASNQIPIMLINGFIEGDNIYCCLSNDYLVMRNLTASILSNNIDKLFYLYRKLDYSASQKLKGFRDALVENNINKVEKMVKMVTGTIKEVQESLMKVDLSQYDVILTADDELAVAALKAAKAQGISVPDTLSIIGYNNSKIAICSTPELTSIDSNVTLLSKITVENLMKVLNKEQVPNRMIISAYLIKRETTK